MLKKLLYNDLYAIAKHSLPFIIAMLGCGALSFGIVLLDAVLPTTGDLATFFDNTLTSLLFIILFGFLVLIILAELQVFSHYYRSFFTDEGYFTFMLPATREELLVSKILAGILWLLAVLVTTVTAVAVGVLIPFEILMRAENASFLSSLLRTLGDTFSVLGIFDFLFSLMAQTVFIYTAITLGALFLTKKKLLGAFLAYCVLSGAVSFLRTLFSLLFYSVTDSGEVFTYLISILLSFSVSIGGYLITRALLKHKLNLV